MITHHNKMMYIASIEAIPSGEGRVFMVDETPIAVFHGRSGRGYATQANCPHKEGPLADGIVGGSVLICPLHGWKFNLESGEGPDCRITTYPVTVDSDGRILLEIAR